MRLYIHGGSYNFLYESSGHCVARDLHLLLGVLNRKKSLARLLGYLRPP